MTEPFSPVDFGRRVAVVRSGRRRFSMIVDRRTVGVCIAVAAICAAVTVFAISGGAYSVAPGDSLRALFGGGDEFLQTVVRDWRLPRALLAVLLGASLGAAGAIFQSLTRNPLGSPDVIGFDTGAYTGALLVIIVMQRGYPATAFGALAGGAVTALAVYALAWKRGIQGFRLIIIGISVAAGLSALCTYLIMRAELPVAMAAGWWGAGSLNDADWNDVRHALIALAPIVACLVVLQRPLAMLEFGDDVAGGRGIAVERSRLALIFVGVACSAVTIALAGPIGFVALVAPQLARRVTRSGSVGIAAAAAMGALLLAVSDAVARRAFPDTELPVGLVTVSLGGLYLLYLLIQEGRRR